MQDVHLEKKGELPEVDIDQLRDELLNNPKSKKRSYQDRREEQRKDSGLPMVNQDEEGSEEEEKKDHERTVTEQSISEKPVSEQWPSEV